MFNRNKIKIGTKKVLNAFYRAKVKTFKPRIIYYHSVAPQRPLSHSPAEFEKQLLWLKSMGYQGLRMDELHTVIRRSDFHRRRYVFITFDDGYCDNVDVALPILISCGFKATFFIVAGMLRENERAYADDGYRLYPGRSMMNYTDLRKLSINGMEIASHGWTHRQSTRMDKSSGFGFPEELAMSKELLERIIGGPVNSFSYPNGQRGAFSARTRAQVIEAGYKNAATTIWGALTPSYDLFGLPRCEISAMDPLNEFQEKMTGKREYLRLVARSMKRSKTWFKNASKGREIRDRKRSLLKK